MARHADPRELAELKGATAKDPQRYRNTPPKSELPIGNAPEEMSDEAKAAWFEISTYSIEGVLTESDRLSLELASELVAEFREDRRAFTSSKMAQLVGLIARFGMTPTDRQKLSINKKQEDDDDFVML